MFVTCDTCGESFDVQKEVKTVKRKIKGSSVEIKFFVCPTCGKKYIFFGSEQKSKVLDRGAQEVIQTNIYFS